MANEVMGDARPVVTRAEAKTAGVKRYWTGVECKNGHIAERLVVNGGCIECLAQAEIRYREANREKFRAKWRRFENNPTPGRKERHKLHDKKWREANADKVAEKSKKWAEANPERKLEHSRRWRERNLEFKQAKVREWRDANRDSEEYKAKAVARVKEWAKENPEGVRKNTHARRARQKGAEGSHTKEELVAILKRQEWRCVEPTCGASLRLKRHLDHIMPLAKGGTNYANNLQYLCPSCNCRKHAKDPLEWAKLNGRLI